MTWTHSVLLNNVIILLTHKALMLRWCTCILEYNVLVMRFAWLWWPTIGIRQDRKEKWTYVFGDLRGRLALLRSLLATAKGRPHLPRNNLHETSPKTTEAIPPTRCVLVSKRRWPLSFRVAGPHYSWETVTWPSLNHFHLRAPHRR